MCHKRLKKKKSKSRFKQKGTKVERAHLHREAGDEEVHAETYNEGKW